MSLTKPAPICLSGGHDISSLGYAELQALYEGMTRHILPHEREERFEGDGPLSKDWFDLDRQIVFRRLISLQEEARESGVIYATKPGEVMHIQV